MKKFLIFVGVVLAILLGGIFYYKKIHTRHYVPLPPRPEINITIIPGWNLRQVADYLVKQGVASSIESVYSYTGKPAYDYRRTAFALPKIADLQVLSNKPDYVSLEGYLAPETYRIYSDATIIDVLKKILTQRDKEITDQMRADASSSDHSFFEILTMASLLEEEVQKPEDKALVADILWRRYKKGWPLQVDSSVHYAIDKQGIVSTSKQEREIDSPWNTYKYPGLPLGPISNPGLESINAALYPQKNDYWFFLTGKDGTVYYAKTLEEHNLNKHKYL